MIYYNGGVCYILLKEGKYTVKISHVVPTNPQIAEELLLMNIAKAHEEMEEGMCHCQLYVKTKDESIQG